MALYGGKPVLFIRSTLYPSVNRWWKLKGFQMFAPYRGCIQAASVEVSLCYAGSENGTCHAVPILTPAMSFRVEDVRIFPAGTDGIATISRPHAISHKL